MSYKIDFVNNARYGADDINAIRSTVMTSGVIRNTDDACMVTVASDGIHIEAGEALFGDGCRIEMTDEEIISYNEENCYVYFNRNYYSEPCLEKGASLPENCIPLGQITEGVVNDLRSYATLKIPTMAPNRYLSKELELDFSANNPKQVTKRITFEDRTDLTYVTLIHESTRYKTRFLIDFVHGYAFGFCGDGQFPTYGNHLLLTDIGLHITYRKTGNTLIFDIEADTSLNLGYATITAL